MDDLNDVRLALGALQNAMRNLTEQVEDITAFISRVRAVEDLAVYAERTLAELPALLDAMTGQIERDPMLGMIVGPHLRTLVAALNAGHARRRAGDGPPAIEHL